MSRAHRVAVIGAGRPRSEAGATGFGMAHGHVRGFLATGRCELAAVADVRREAAEDFAARFGGTAEVFTDYHEMLDRVRPDLVSVCTWPALHAEMVIAACRAGVRGIHCEKPMAPTWEEARAMHQAALDSGTVLTFNHQRRFLEPFQQARRMVQEGEIGELLRIEGQCPNLFDWGTHWFDMFFFYNGETPAEWVLGQVDRQKEHLIFGIPHEDQGLCHFKFRNGVRATLHTGFDADVGCQNRLIGSAGAIEIHDKAPHLRVRRDAEAGWREVPTAEGLHDPVAIDRATADLVRAVETGERPLLSSFHAIQSTEVIFACYSSAREGKRIDLRSRQSQEVAP